MKQRSFFVALLLTTVVMLSGCQGSKLPEGMDESALEEKGREVVTALNQGDYAWVYDQMRSDAQETTTEEDIQAYIEEVVATAGVYEADEEILLTGQTLDSGERYGTAVFYSRHEEKDVVYRIAFSTDLELMGFQIQTK